jgi:energy-coupling factor transport system ATP-binding protein
VIELCDLVHTYPGGDRGLAGVNLRVGRGEYLAIVGRNGAGKTTLIKHLNRLLDPTSGTVRVNGLAASTLEPWELARHVGYVFQNPDHQIFNATVAGEVRYGLSLAGLPATEVEQRLDEVLALTGLDAVRTEHPFSLAKGQRQRIAVASILALRPAVLVVDEPTTGQDWAGVQEMMALIDRLNREGTTVLLVTHDLDLVAQHARRVVVMDDGLIVADGPTAEVLRHRDLLSEAGVDTTQAVALSLRLWPDALPLLDEAALGRHVAGALAEGVPGAA